MTGKAKEYLAKGLNLILLKQLTFFKYNVILNIPTVCNGGFFMARNKYPEETRQLILQVSLQLFMQQGYEKTSLNDIINHLGGLTKGAIYHHFKSKEEILVAVVNEICSGTDAIMRAILRDETLNGKEKFEKMFSSSLQNPTQDDVFSITPNLLDNPTFLAYYLKTVILDIIPNYAVPVIEEGVADGSIETEYPKELAGVIMLICNVWLNPLIVSFTTEELVRRASLINQMFERFNLRILDPEMIDRFNSFKR